MKNFFTPLPYWFIGLLLLIAILGAESVVEPTTDLLKKKVLGVTQNDSPSCLDQGCIQKWRQVVDKYPDYTDGFLQLSQISWDNLDTPNSKNYLNTAFSTDSNNEQVKHLKNIFD